MQTGSTIMRRGYFKMFGQTVEGNEGLAYCKSSDLQQ